MVSSTLANSNVFFTEQLQHILPPVPRWDLDFIVFHEGLHAIGKEHSDDDFGAMEEFCGFGEF